MAKLNYCIITGKDRPFTMFATLPNELFLDPSVMNSEHFPEFKSILEKHGLEQVYMMRFESKDDIKLRPLMAALRKKGFIRSAPLEKLINIQMEQVNTRLIVFDPDGTNHSSTPVPSFLASGFNFTYNTSSEKKKTKSPIKKNNPVLKVGEEIKLHLYLFIRINPMEDNSVEFDFEFDMFSKDSNDLCRYIKIIECTFVRKRHTNKGVMYLESKEKLHDILKELDFLYTINFIDPNDIMEGEKPKYMVYNAIELKEYIDLNDRLCLHLDIEDNYDHVIHFSNKIKGEKVAHDKNMRIPVSLIKRASESVMERMEQRMLHYSKEEDYELASSYQKNYNYIKKKAEALGTFEAKGVEFLTNEQYEKDFTMRDFEF